MPKPKKIGKDVFDTKATGILRTARERAEYEEYKRQKLAQDQDQVEQEKEEEEEKKKTTGSERMVDEKEPRPEGLTPEEFAEMKRLAELKKLKVSKVVLKEEEE